MSDTNPFSDVEQCVRNAWEARCGVRRGPLEQADVDAIAEAAFALEGVKPTVEFIRRIAGGGSPNTIHPKLDAWFRQGRPAAAPNAVPAELLTLWERLQIEAARVAQDALAPLAVALADDRTALTVAQAQLAVDQAALASERATTERVVAALREEFQGLQARNEALQAELAQLSEQIRDAAERIGQRDREVERLQREGAQATAEHTRLSRLLAASDDNCASQQAELEAARMAALAGEARIVALQADAAASAAALAEAQEAAAAEGRARDSAQKAVATLTARVGQLEHALALGQATADAEAALRDHMATDLVRERDALEESRGHAEAAGHALIALRTQVEAVTAERDRLQARLDDWASAQRSVPATTPSDEVPP
jgi:chromosome segregation ATPase